VPKTYLLKPLSLALLVPRVLAYHQDLAVAPYDLAFIAHLFD